MKLAAAASGALRLCDGKRNARTVVDELRERYDAGDEMGPQVEGLLKRLFEAGVLVAERRTEHQEARS